ncbi:DUF2490 domain-containing protein [Flavobacterium sp.]|uniref:DUF2490 domain-containing protein n=1 Tax=Flavobacterium sp. TaxID=239 RepID=UPI0037533159
MKINKKTKIALWFAMLFFQMVVGQKQQVHQKLIWYGYYSILKINENWKVNSEVQERHFINPSAQHQLVFRSNVERKIIHNWSGLIGFTLFLQSPQDPNSNSSLIVPELRPSIGITNFEKLGSLKITNKYQLEARFFHNQNLNELVSGYTFSNFRFRYQIGFDYPILRKEQSDKLVIKLKDEVMLNIGNQIVKNTFDQNRIYGGIQYVVNPKVALELGYLNWFQQQKSGIDYYNRDILRFSITHSIALKK